MSTWRRSGDKEAACAGRGATSGGLGVVRGRFRRLVGTAWLSGQRAEDSTCGEVRQ